MSNIVEITESAEEYLGNLLKDSEEKDTNISPQISQIGINLGRFRSRKSII